MRCCAPISTKALIVVVITLVLVLVVFVGYRRYVDVLKVLGMFLLAYLVTVFVLAHGYVRHHDCPLLLVLAE